jgi:5-methylcytosine-specific restriction endonuclease McrA
MGSCASVQTADTAPQKLRKKSIPKSLKKLVWDTWIGEDVGSTFCMCCNHEKIRQIEFHCGHIISEKQGGGLTVENLRPICAQCNLSMGTMNMHDFKRDYFKNFRA